METVVVTLRQQKKEIDLELPTAVPLFTLTPILIEKFTDSDLSGFTGDKIITRVINSKTIIRPHETLGQAGVVDGDILELKPVITTNNQAIPNSEVAGTFLQCVDTGQSFSCAAKANLIGRSKDCRVNLINLPQNDVVSRIHANILRRPDGFWLKDERSTNGTFVDGYRLEPSERVKIRNGQRLQFGEDGPVLVFYTSII